MDIIPGVRVSVLCASVVPMSVLRGMFYFFSGDVFVSYAVCVGVKPNVGMETMMHYLECFLDISRVRYPWCISTGAASSCQALFTQCLIYFNKYRNLFLEWGMSDATISPP